MNHEQPNRVYSPDDWRILNDAPLPAIPGVTSTICAAIKDNGNPCGNLAIHGVPFCRAHGGTTLTVQEQARRRIDMVRSQLFTKLCAAAEKATDTYISIMENGKKDSDRIAAADRVLKLLGFDDSVSQVPGLEDEGEASDIDKQLAELLQAVAAEKLAGIIDVKEVTDEPSGEAAATEERAESAEAGDEPLARSEDGVEVEASSSG